MPSSEYAAVPSTGKLKLKGGPALGDPKVSKKKKKHRSKDPQSVPEDESSTAVKKDPDEARSLTKALKDEDRDIASSQSDKKDAGGSDIDGSEIRRDREKTAAEKRWEEQRRRRLDDRLQREGIKSHKERVEELNKYLSKLSEHHDMPRIGPG